MNSQWDLVQMMSPTQSFFARMAMRAFQLFCLLFVLVGLANINPLITAIEATIQGAMSIPDMCWKILPVTGPLIPAIACLAGAQIILKHIKPSTHKPSEPWMANPMWAAKHIRLSNRGLFWAVAMCFLFYIGIAIPLSIGTKKTPFLVFCGIFGLILFLIARVFWLNRKWNTSELRMALVPGVVGGPFSGVAILQQTFPAGTAFDVCLKCQQTKTNRDTERPGRSTYSTTETVWSSTISIDKPLPPDASNRTLVPFSFAIPFDCEPTSPSFGSSTILTKWNLVVQQKGKVGFGGAVFTVPIFRTQESRRDFEFDEELIASYQQEVDLESVLSRLPLKQETLKEGGKRLSFAFWNSSTAIATSVMLLVCSAIIAAFFWFVPNIYRAVFAAIFPGVFLVAGFYTLLDMWLWKSSIEIDKQGIRCVSGWNGLRKTLILGPLEKPTFLSEFDIRKENGEWYRVDIIVPSVEPGGSDSRMTIVKRLDGREEANAVARWLRHETDSPASRI
jgi:hypothetical protein